MKKVTAVMQRRRVRQWLLSKKPNEVVGLVRSAYRSVLESYARASGFPSALIDTKTWQPRADRRLTPLPAWAVDYIARLELRAGAKYEVPITASAALAILKDQIEIDVGKTLS